jgi:hypothetical protein
MGVETIPDRIDISAAYEAPEPGRGDQDRGIGRRPAEVGWR